MGIFCRKKNFLIPVLLLVFLCGCGFSSGEEEYEQGIAAYERGAYREAADFFAQAIAENEDCAEYYLYYGFSLIELGSYEAAE